MFGVTLMIGLLVVVGRCFGFWLFGCLLVWFWLRLTGGSWFWFAGCRRGGDWLLRPGLGVVDVSLLDSL